ncbi:hypothetical protein EDC94DRAFT_647281 [Helicostylum pulchrum]|nr:hypothetical protein EDC94DRAFT_647281 [Helicostylum pulchrum]
MKNLMVRFYIFLIPRKIVYVFGFSIYTLHNTAIVLFYFNSVYCTTESVSPCSGAKQALQKRGLAESDILSFLMLYRVDLNIKNLIYIDALTLIVASLVLHYIRRQQLQNWKDYIVCTDHIYIMFLMCVSCVRKVIAVVETFFFYYAQTQNNAVRLPKKKSCSHIIVYKSS